MSAKNEAIIIPFSPGTTPEEKQRIFNSLISKFSQKIYWHVRRIVITHEDADDATQSTFIKVWENMDSFRNESAVYTWIYRIATNEALQILKKKRLRNFISLSDVESELSRNLHSDPYFNGDQAQIKLQQAILTLPEKQRIVFNMKYFEQMKYEEMSEILNTSVGALKASYHHAVKKIEKFLT